MINSRRITRRQARAWLYPIRKCLRQLLYTGEADTIRGYAVTLMPGDKDYARIDYCAAGFRALMVRLCAHIDTTPLLRIERRLSAGAPLTADHLESALRMLNAVEDDLIKHSAAEIKGAVLDEQISIEMDAMREAA